MKKEVKTEVKTESAPTPKKTEPSKEVKKEAASTPSVKKSESDDDDLPLVRFDQLLTLSQDFMGHKYSPTVGPQEDGDAQSSKEERG